MNRKEKDFLIKEEPSSLNVSIKTMKDTCLIEAIQVVRFPKARLNTFLELFEEIRNLGSENYFLRLNSLENSSLAIYSSCDAKELDRTVDAICADLNCYKNLLENLIIEGEKEDE